jgi:hypothetical protein
MCQSIHVRLHAWRERSPFPHPHWYPALDHDMAGVRNFIGCEDTRGTTFRLALELIDDGQKLGR